MDPTACLRRIHDTMWDDSEEGIRERNDACADLRDWLDSGGFAPDWEAYDWAANYFDCYVDPPSVYDNPCF